MLIGRENGEGSMSLDTQGKVCTSVGGGGILNVIVISSIRPSFLKDRIFCFYRLCLSVFDNLKENMMKKKLKSYVMPVSIIGCILLMYLFTIIGITAIPFGNANRILLHF
jgi:hypothetical protein